MSMPIFVSALLSLFSLGPACPLPAQVWLPLTGLLLYLFLFRFSGEVHWVFVHHDDLCTGHSERSIDKRPVLSL